MKHERFRQKIVYFRCKKVDRKKRFFFSLLLLLLLSIYLLAPEVDDFLSKALVFRCFLVFRRIGEYISLDLFYYVIDSYISLDLFYYVIDSYVLCDFSGNHRFVVLCVYLAQRDVMLWPCERPSLFSVGLN